MIMRADEQGCHVTATLHTLPNKHGERQRVLAGEDLEAILEMLEANEGVEEQFINEVENVQSQEIIYKKCGKKYKTKGGYERHQATKHRDTEHQVPFSGAILNDILKDFILNLKDNKAHSEVLRSEL
ncbi:uncharacterized protein LOC110247139 [Exaiptasia diaphana]|uniref:Uncharacterized protein n=1 Tax=Exaiptasia diaphana TaxID=2652724 RepID=A0A913XRQ1_EXADI|nr:uncharacterized protein LOC110247139 [Exaiptasia diaphana]